MAQDEKGGPGSPTIKATPDSPVPTPHVDSAQLLAEVIAELEATSHDTLVVRYENGEVVNILEKLKRIQKIHTGVGKLAMSALGALVKISNKKTGTTSGQEVITMARNYLKTIGVKW